MFGCQSLEFFLEKTGIFKLKLAKFWQKSSEINLEIYVQKRVQILTKIVCQF